MKKSKILTLGLTLKGKKLLDMSDDYFNDIEEYIETLEDKEQTIFAYLYIVKIICGFDEESRNEIIKAINETKWEKIE